MNRKAKQFYQKEFDSYFKKIELLTQQIKNYSRIRILWFLLCVLALYFFSSTTLFWFGSVFLFFLVTFLIIAVQHERLIGKKKEAIVFERINRDELSALEGNYSSFDEGKEFIDTHHP